MSLGGQDCRISLDSFSTDFANVPGHNPNIWDENTWTHINNIYEPMLLFIHRQLSKDAHGKNWQQQVPLGPPKKPGSVGRCCYQKGSKVKVCFEESKIIVVEMVIQLFDPHIYIYVHVYIYIYIIIIIMIIIIIDNIYNIIYHISTCSRKMQILICTVWNGWSSAVLPMRPGNSMLPGTQRAEAQPSSANGFVSNVEAFQSCVASAICRYIFSRIDAVMLSHCWCGLYPGCL